MRILVDHVGSALACWMAICTTSFPGTSMKRAVTSSKARTSPSSNSICSNLSTGNMGIFLAHERFQKVCEVSGEVVCNGVNTP